MKKKSLENWFTERLTENQVERAGLASGSGEATVPGWLWACNQFGEFAYCSPEVRQVLDVPADGFLGQPLALYRLTQSSAARLDKLLSGGNFPAEIAVRYIHRHGGLVDVNVHIFAEEVDEYQPHRIYGFSQKIFEPNPAVIPVTGNSGFQVEENIYFPTTGEIESASQKVMELLVGLRLGVQEIKNAPESRVIRFSSMQAMEDEGHDRVIQSTLFDRVVTERPTYYKIAMEHRLEWGRKLKLTPSQKAQVERLKKRMWGPLGWLQSQYHPHSILRYDKYWIAVWIEVVEGRTANLVIKYQEPGMPGLLVPFQEFVEKPEDIHALLRRAVLRPYHAEAWLFSGLDYLVSVNGNK